MASAWSAERPPTAGVDLSAAQLLDALTACSGVLDQHADALDRLDVHFDWDGELSTEPLDVLSDRAGRADRADQGRLAGDLAPGDGSDGVGSGREAGPGTDFAVTLGGACEAASNSRDFSSLTRGLCHGATASATGETGRHLAAFLTGVGDALRNADRLDAARLALALEAGVERVTEADDGAHPGSLLAVMAASADGALSASDAGSDLVEVLVSAAEAGLVELEQGPLIDAQLAERGTVDAGGAGFLLLLDSLAAAVTGEPMPAPPQDHPLQHRSAKGADAVDGAGAATSPTGAITGHRFVVRCQIRPPRADIEAAAELEVVIYELSDRLVFDGSGTRWTVEVVTAFPGAVVEALAGSGVLSELHIGVSEPSSRP